MTTRKRRIRQEWVRNLARPQVREGVRLAVRTAPPVVDVEQATGPEYDLLIYDVIDSWGGYWGVSASDVMELLAQVEHGTINVRINSPGGDYFEGVTIGNALRRHPANIVVHVDGMAASAASVIAMASGKRVMGLGSQMMIHRASSIAMGNAADMLSTAAMLDQTDDDIAALYAECAGGDAAAWRAAMDAETWYTAATAVECGLATELAGKDAVSVSEPLEEDPADEEDDEVDGVVFDAAVAPVLTALRMALRPDVSRETTDSTAHPGGRSSAFAGGFDPSALRSAIRKAM